MKRILILLTAVFVLTASFASSSIIVKPPVKASEILVPVGKSGEKISLLDLSHISISEFQSLTGKKLNLADKVSFKLAQRELRRSIRNDGTLDTKKAERFMKSADGTTGFHLGGFALGFFLGLIGVLIAYLIKDEKKSNRVKWAWIGLVAWLVIWLAFVI
jgi:hypothetical protein